jgi:hypothetical protein
MRVAEAAARAAAALGRAFVETLSRKDLPYKVATYDPQQRQFTIHTSKWTFPEAFTHPKGTHVVQTHASAAEYKKIVRGGGSAGGSSAAQRAGVGFMPSLLTAVHLIDLDTGRQIWPPPQPSMAAAFAAIAMPSYGRRFGPDWWKDNERRAAAQRAEQQRMADYYARLTQEQDECENAEARERFAALQRNNRI